MSDSTAPRPPDNAAPGTKEPGQRKMSRAEIRGTYLREVNRPKPRRNIPRGLWVLLVVMILAVVILLVMDRAPSR